MLPGWKLNGLITWCMLDGSWLMAQGSWLMARGGQPGARYRGAPVRDQAWRSPGPCGRRFPWSSEPWTIKHASSLKHQAFKRAANCTCFSMHRCPTRFQHETSSLACAQSPINDTANAGCATCRILFRHEASSHSLSWIIGKSWRCNLPLEGSKLHWPFYHRCPKPVPDIGKCWRWNLPPDCGKLHRLFHSSVN